MDQVLTDLLADLMHWARRERVDFNRACQMADTHFQSEG
jgi:hypothetical protein